MTGAKTGPPPACSKPRQPRRSPWTSRFRSTSTARPSPRRSTRERCSSISSAINLGLTGTHVGCDTAQCGACTVHVDGRAVKACNVLAAQVDGAKIATIEGIGDDRRRCTRCRQAFKECHGLQCGFCTPGMVMSAVDLVQRHPHPTEQADPRASSTATSAAAPATTTSSRRCSRAPPPWRSEEAAMGANEPGVGRRLRPAQGRRALPHRRGPVHRRRGAAAADARRTSCARRTRTRASAASTLARAKAAPGVVAIYTGADLTGVNGLPCGWLITGTDGKPMKEPPHPVLAQGKVRYVGDPVALVVAETVEPGEGRGRADRGRLRGAAGGGERARRAQAGRAADPRRGARTTSATTGRSATRRRSTPRSRRPRTSPSSTSSTTG